MARSFVQLFAVVAGFLFSVGVALAQMTINGRPVDPETAALLTEQYEVPANGVYWYDPQSGLTGDMGAPPGKQIAPGETRFGPAPLEASGQASGVRINGRAISFKELFALEHVYTMMVDGDYVMGPDLVMRKNYEGAPPFNYGQAWNAYAQAQDAERQWCAMVRERIASKGPGAPVLVPELGGPGYSVQVTQDANGCMMANVQGRIFSRCCDQ